MTDTPNKPKDRWDKLEVVLHPLGGLLTALAVTAVGVMGSQVLNRRQAVDTNARLYSELMSRREESESSLRKDMFVSIIQTFLKPGAGDLDTKVLNLELLAYNFHESLNVKPLFLDIARRLDAPDVKDRQALRDRLNRIAREITAKQMFALEGHGKSFRRTIDLDEVRSQGRSGVALESEPMHIGGRACDVNLYVLDSDPESQQLKLRLEVKAPENSQDPVDTRAEFYLGWYDFPMIDNTRLANGLRCAVTLSNFSPSMADVTTVCFPGEYASLKDRPYYDEVIQKLQEATQ
ncbi:MAG TPA: hypothetical protein VFG76_08545 [Candidatus Polarisedimenticolia bacterium]|nr:hypothetical protein [Candidatus Polarisedimenticolia bacterium]